LARSMAGTIDTGANPNAAIFTGSSRTRNLPFSPPMIEGSEDASMLLISPANLRDDPQQVSPS